MDCFDVLSIPRFLGNDSQNDVINVEKNEWISKLIKDSKKRKRLRTVLRNESQEEIEELDKTNGEIEVDINDRNDSIEDKQLIETNVDIESDAIFQEEDDVNDVNVNEETVKSAEFGIIGEINKPKPIKVKPVLSEWLTKPIVFERDINKFNKSLNEFSNIIEESLITKLKDNKISQLFPVQQQVIPYLIKSFNNSKIFRPKDVCVSSPTGSGKTLSFVIPIVQHLLKRVITRIRVIIVLPVRDLAIQVFQVFQKYCQKTSLKVGLVIGHKSFSEECNSLIRKSIDGSKYHSLVDILVATPGKLVDLIQRGEGFSLKDLEILVLDESDRMVSELQFNWLQEIESSVFGTNTRFQCYCSVDSYQQNRRYNVHNHCSCYNSESIDSKPIHKILFSATLSTDPEKLKPLALFQPILFMSSSDTNSGTLEISSKHIIPTELKELMTICTQDRKPLIIWYLIEVLNYRKVLCFTGSVENTHRLYSLLKQIPNISVAEFSSKRNAKTREKILNKFVFGKIDIIVCSDIFARGLDIEGIDCVICYDPPRNETAYIHRIGRTARAGNKGTAITLLTPTQLSHFNIVSRRAHNRNTENKNAFNIEKMVIKESQLKPLITKYKSALEVLSKHVKNNETKIKVLKRSLKF